jgi:hypothetical protein
MEKSPPRSYKKQQKKKRILNELPKSSKNTKKTPNISLEQNSWSKNLQKLEDRKATSTWFWRTQLNSLTSGTTAIV